MCYRLTHRQYWFVKCMSTLHTLQHTDRFRREYACVYYAMCSALLVVSMCPLVWYDCHWFFFRQQRHIFKLNHVFLTVINWIVPHPLHHWRCHVCQRNENAATNWTVAVHIIPRGQPNFNSRRTSHSSVRYESHQFIIQNGSHSTKLTIYSKT